MHRGAQNPNGLLAIAIAMAINQRIMVPSLHPEFTGLLFKLPFKLALGQSGLSGLWSVPGQGAVSL